MLNISKTAHNSDNELSHKESHNRSNLPTIR